MPDEDLPFWVNIFNWLPIARPYSPSTVHVNLPHTLYIYSCSICHELFQAIIPPTFLPPSTPCLIESQLGTFGFSSALVTWRPGVWRKREQDVLDSILNSNFLLTWIWGHCICPKTPELSLLLVKDPIKTAWDTCSIHVTYFPCQQQPLSLDSLLCSAFTSTLCSLHLRPTLSQFSSTTAKAHLFLFVSLFVSQHLQSPIVNLPPLPAGLLISSLLVNDH